MRSRFFLITVIILLTISFADISAAQPPKGLTIIAWSNAGDLLAIASEGGIDILDAQSMKTLKTLPCLDCRIVKFAWSMDDHYLAASVFVSDGLAVHAYDLSRAILITTFPPQQGGSFALAWDIDAKRIFLGREYPDGGSFDALNLATNTVSQVLRRSVMSMAYSPDRTQIALGTLGGRVILLKSDTLEIALAPKVTHEVYQPALQVAWSPDGKKIATGLADGMVIVWDAETNLQLQILSGATEITTDKAISIRTIAFDATGTRLQSVNAEGILRVWDTQTWAVITEASLGQIGPAAWSPDGTTLAYGTDTYSSADEPISPLQLIRLADLLHSSPTPKP